MEEERDDGSFEKRLMAARKRQEADAPRKPAGTRLPSMGVGARVGVELASALVVGLIIGYWLDRWLHTRPVFLLLFLLVGMGAGIMNVWREVLPRKKPAPRDGGTRD